MTKLIYLDNHSTTPLDPRVLKAMLPYFKERFGNAASRTHALGDEARAAVERARAQVAKLIGAEPREIVFTSGATESNNLALKGVAEAYRGKAWHIVTVATEHRSVLDACRRVEMEGFKLTVLGIKKDGQIDLEKLKKAITSQTIVVSVMWANNEIGTIQPIKEIAKITRKAGVLFHSDAAQALGKIPIDVKKTGVDLLSITAHKVHGPKGVGALYLRKTGSQIKMLPLLDGGGHEGGYRSGTLNVPGIVGFGEACRIYSESGKAERARLKLLRDRLLNQLRKGVPGLKVNGSLSNRLPNNLNVSLPGIDAHALMLQLKHVALSSGSACLSSSEEPSYVLKALGIPADLRRSSLRFGLSRFNTAQEVDRAVYGIIKVLRRNHGAHTG